MSTGSNKLNDLTPKKWTQYSTTIIPTDNLYEVIDRIIEIYSKSNEKVFYFSLDELVKNDYLKRTNLKRDFNAGEGTKALLIFNILQIENANDYYTLKENIFK